MISLRPAADDLPALQALMPLSARALSRGCYTEAQVESAIRHVFGVDTQLVADGTYLVAETEGRIVGCGGWSRRRTLYGGDRSKAAGREADDDPLDPAREPARIRAFFVRLELMATLPGEALYRSFASRPSCPTASRSLSSA